MYWLVTDHRSNFKNELFCDLTEEFRIHRHFTTAYSPLWNSKIEGVIWEILRSFPFIIFEWILTHKNWSSVVDCVQGILNCPPFRDKGQELETLDYGAIRSNFMGALTLFTLMRAFLIKKQPTAILDDLLWALQLVDIGNIQEALNGINKEVKVWLASARSREVIKHKRNTSVLPANFEFGYFFVLLPQKKGIRSFLSVEVHG